MPYRLTGKATVRTNDFRAQYGETITDAQWQTLDARRQEWFEKIVNKIKKPRRGNTQPLPVEEPRPDPIPAE